MDRLPLVLIAEDGDVDRRILTAFVERSGYRVIAAVDGVEACELFDQHHPDIVLMDAMMPRRSGFEAARHIKQFQGESFTPLIFLTALREPEELARCLEAGGDDFLSKPYNKVILGAKLSAFMRMRNLHEQLREQSNFFARSTGHLQHEQSVAKAVFDNVMRVGAHQPRNVKQHVSPLAIFNGDVVLTATTPAGGVHVMVGDFTGHGLPAAIGALPTADIFYGMTAKGFSPGEILREMNKKLKRVLPVGVFCCASFVAMDFRSGEVGIWHGGLPEAIIFRAATRSVELVHSRNVPLGVVNDARMNSNLELFQLAPGDRVFLCSDGVLELPNNKGEMLGLERLLEVFKNVREPAVLFEDVVAAVNQYVDGAPHLDDLTMVEVAMCDDSVIELDGAAPSEERPGPSDLRFSIEFGAESLKSFNPLPMLQQMILQVPGLVAHASKLHTVLSELFANALDHGVLGLQSDMKHSASGFQRYFAERGRRLSELNDGFVAFEIVAKPTAEGGELKIVVRDSGDGFDHSRMCNLSQDDALSGRGVRLIRHLCTELNYVGSGNHVEVLYRWSRPQ